MNNTNTTFNRGDASIQNVLRMARPILEDKGVIGSVIKVKELAQILRNHHRRLPVRSYCVVQLVEEINNIMPRFGGLFVFDDLEIQIYRETDPYTGRHSPSIEINRLVSLEKQDQDSQLKEQVK